MSQRILDYVRTNKLLVIGLVVAPLGMYSGIQIKEWRTQQKIKQAKQQVDSASQQQTIKSSDDDTEIRVELQELRAVRGSLRREELLLGTELDSIASKLQRLDERDARGKK
ncbi:hypothetical protein GGI07_003027 [Coemansia sp. Benny D115]|nr:hypothetical protein GGI07_003027 [Coemansia sp. Benny D115]